MAILKAKNQVKTRTLSVRVDADLLAQIDALRIDAGAAGFEFDTAEVCARALATAVKSARAELAAATPPQATPQRLDSAAL
ncbi:hypothetical protein [Thiomonas arsenitoxydans]|uniref:Uncharacterized protein n=1 Tax=Thiomonas arsenitoxydans (strain DSM 22701 / CIP 110005 / 3As) TaxID=426114 RepID=D6CTV4_THIA3|nr:hypothetical protein [Thiomonas arsenitoxydans]CAZ88723.1 hypothetical protein THI_2068 [Thiomonas arsenitoxydans]